MKFSKRFFFFLSIFILLNMLIPCFLHAQVNTNSYKGLKEYIDAVYLDKADTDSVYTKEAADTTTEAAIAAALTADAKIKKVYANTDPAGTTGPNITLKQGLNVMITRSGDTFEIAATGGTGGGSADATVEILADEMLTAGDVVFFTDYAGTLKARKSVEVFGTPSVNTPSYLQSGGKASTSLTCAQLTENLSVVAFTSVTDGKFYAAFVTQTLGNVAISDVTLISDDLVYTADISPISLTEAVVAYRSGTTGYLWAAKLTYSGGVLTMSKNTALTNYVLSATKVSIANINPMQSVALFRSSVDDKAYTMLIAEDESSFSAVSTIAASSPLDAMSAACDIQKLNSGSAIGVFDGSNNHRVVKYDVTEEISIVGQLDIAQTGGGLVSLGILNSAQLIISTRQQQLHLVSILENTLTLVDTETLANCYDSIFTPTYPFGGFITYGLDNSQSIKIAPVIVSGNAITIGAPLNTGYTAYSTLISGTSMDTCKLTSTYFAIVFSDKNDSNYGKIMLYNAGVTTISPRPKVAGIVQNNTIKDDTASVLISGTSKVHSDLIPNAYYYLQSANDLSIGTVPVTIANVNIDPNLKGEVRVGLAKSETELVLDIDYSDGRERVSSIKIGEEMSGTTGSTITLQAGNNIEITRMNDAIQIAASGGGGATASEDTGVYIENNTTWEFSADYDTTAVMLYRNGIYQPRRLYTTEDIAGKTRSIFSSALNASDEIILISTK